MKYPEDFINKVICGNVLDELRKFPSDCIDTIITSPPYWGLRDYGEDTKTIWGGDEKCEHQFNIIADTLRKATPGDKPSSKSIIAIHRSNKENRPGKPSEFCSKCGAWFGQLGLEPTLDLYINHLLQITAELKRVLKKSGVLWWNHGDCYGGSGMGLSYAGHTKGPKSILSDNLLNAMPKVAHVRGKYNKCLLLQNWRLILKMIDEQGWILRNTIIWNKPNAMPSSVKDRFANKYEPVFFLTKSQKYFFDLDAVRIPAKTNENRPLRKESFNYRVRDSQKKSEQCPQFKATKEEIERYKKGQTSIPQAQAESFGSPRARYWRKQKFITPDQEGAFHLLGKNPGDVWTIATQPCPKEYRGVHFATFPEKLVEPMILAGCPKEGIVLDPFCGLGTTCVVAKRLNRNYIGIEISKEYAKLAEKRINNTPTSLF